MVTNDKEYQREYQAEYRKSHPQKQYRKSKEVKKESKEVKKIDPMLVIAKAGLIPPREVETSVESNAHGSFETKEFSSSQDHTDSQASEMDKLDPEYKKWCLSLETQRHYYYTKFGKVYRKNSIEVKKDLKIKKQELDMVELMKKEKTSLYRDCMDELKTVLELRKRNEV